MAEKKSILSKGQNSPELQKEKDSERPFTSGNFWMMGCCLVLIIVGFIMMSGGGTSSQTEFDPSIFSTRRIVVGPLLAFIGFLSMAFAIIWTPRKKGHK